MTDWEKNIAIAEWCGWKWDFNDAKETYWLNPQNPFLSFKEPPDFCNDLNAIHEAEKRLKDSQWGKYTSILLYANNDPKLKGFDKAVAHATAPQRAEALLKTIGKWKE